MALFDLQLTFSDAQVLTATANSTNVVDATSSRNLGSGEPMFLLAKVGTVSGTSPTLTANLVGADDVGFSTNKITIATATPTLAAAQADALVRFGIPSHTAKRYFRIEYTVGGTTPSVTVTAGLVLDQPTSPMT
jgi:hypothetical protein